MTNVVNSSIQSTPYDDGIAHSSQDPSSPLGAVNLSGAASPALSPRSFSEQSVSIRETAPHQHLADISDEL